MMESVGEEPQAIGESNMNIEAIFMNNMLDQMDVLNMNMDALEAENAELRENFIEQGESQADLKMRDEYLEWRYEKTMNELNKFEVAKNQGMEEIVKLWKSLSEALN